MFSDLGLIIYWWSLFLGIGLISLPSASKIFGKFYDFGYIFAKILGLVAISYLIFLLSSLHILSFSLFNSWLIVVLWSIFNIALILKFRKEIFRQLKNGWKISLLEEIIFLLALIFWGYVRAHEPSIHGLEKFMDFGFINSLLRTDFFPPKDIWLTPQTINYYYFGHLNTAILAKLSNIDSATTFNLMMTVIFAFTFACSFSLGFNLFNFFLHKEGGQHDSWKIVSIIPGIISSFLVTLGGNLHPIFAFIRGFNKYWYPDATRFIPYTIHEFPSYSWVVSDLHGHVLDIPFVLLTIAIILALFITKPKRLLLVTYCLLLSLMLSVMYMTNAWDGLIYLVLGGLTLFYLSIHHSQTISQENRKDKFNLKNHYLKFKIFGHDVSFFIVEFIALLLVIGLGFYIFSLPFNLHFKPFVSGVNLVKDRSPIYMLAVLWGFFYFFVISFLIFLRKEVKVLKNLTTTDVFILILVIISTLLLIFPEIAYVKDIYPLHYRANTMFKLGYQAFIMLSLASVYIFMRILTAKKNYFKLLFSGLAVLLFIPVVIYPYFAINSYYNGLKNFYGLTAGLDWASKQYPQDFQAISWLKTTIKGQPVILEAVGESYTDYARVSAFTGLPTVVGWPVHEWLWRGSYDEAGKRDAEVRRAYETKSLEETEAFLEKYQVKYVFVGTLERQKYPLADFKKWSKLGKVVFQSGQTTVYAINL
ncbi:hypothetical protein HY439_03855 [Candidatus Microgenomates bacterium]|nr:hypothetical protein [Candidatus Microgenomates bacterium]